MSGRKTEDKLAGLRGKHLLSLQREKCQGCTHCTRVCPTEAIRVRQGKAEVVRHRCIQCGECIRVCPREAWEVETASLDPIKGGKEDAWAVLDPAVFGQLGNSTTPRGIVQALLEIGFSSVREMDEGLEIYREAVSDLLSSKGVGFPAISSDCPAVVQLVQVKFPSLLENLIPVIPPYEIMASRLKKSDLRDSTRKLYYIVPCLAKAQAAIDPLSSGGGFSGAIPVGRLYNPLKASLHRKRQADAAGISRSDSSFGWEWAFPGGESKALGVEVSLAVDGIHRVADILELIENGFLGEVPFVEAWSCSGGCLGGPLNVQNPFWARFHLLSWIQDHPWDDGSKGSGIDFQGGGRYRLDQPFSPREGMRLDDDLSVAMAKLRSIDEVVKRFPGIDCGSCGCPNCLALAEDVVQGYASEKDCLYVLKGTKVIRSKGKERSSRWKRQKPEGKRRSRGSPSTQIKR